MTHTKTITAALATLLLTTGLSAGTTVVGGAGAQAAEVAEPISSSAPDAAVELGFLGSYETGQFDESAAEITAVFNDTVYTVNAQAATVDIIDASDPTAPTKVGEIAGTGVANSIAVRDDGLGVVALEDEDKTQPGTLMFFDATTASATVLGSVTVGSLPDMVALTPDGRQALVANEGEPADDFSSDPEGSIGVVDLPAEVAAPSQADVRLAGFNDFEEGGTKTLPEGVRVFGPNPEGDLPISRNLEPEYITVAGGTAYATLQEANAIAVVDIEAGEVTDILPLGYKDYGQTGSGLDPSDRDPRDAPTINIAEYPGLKGAYMPDTISTFSSGGTDYLVTANEGDSREWGDFVDAARAKDLGSGGLPPVCETSPVADQLGDDALGRLNVITDLGLSADGSCYEELYSFGARSFSVWTTDGRLVADSGDEFEQLTAEAIPDFFNSNNTVSDLEGRSDDKGPEPEALTIGTVGETTYAFIGFERIGGIAVYDLTDPAAPTFATYFNNRDFSVSVGDEIGSADDPAALLSSAGDLGPEGLTFLSPERSPSGQAALVVGSEVSGTTSIYSIADLTDDGGANAAADAGSAGDGSDANAESSADSNAGSSADSNAEANAGSTTGAAADAAASGSSASQGAETGSQDSDTGAQGSTAGSQDSGANGSSTAGAEAAESGADGTDSAGGSLPRTGADLGQYLLIGALALGLIVLGTVVFVAARRR